ncbi:MAG: PAS domain-containing protein [Burkholderiaceae bacterium]
MPLFHSDPGLCDELLNAIVGGTSDRVALIDCDYRFIGFNEAYRRDFEARFGCTLSLGASFLELVSDRDCALATFGKALRGEAHTVEQAIGSGADRHWYEIEVFPLRRQDRVVGAVHIARDITSSKTEQRELRHFKQELERQVAERTSELRESESLLHKVLDSLFAFVGVLKPDGTLIDVNRGPVEVAGVRPADVVGLKFWDCPWWGHSAAARERVRAECARAAAGEVIRYDTTVRIANDDQLMIDYMIAPLRDESGRITHLVPSAVDITDRVRAQRDLAHSTRLLNAIAEQTDDLLFVKDRNGRMVMANPAALRALGKRADRVIGRSNAEIIDDPEQARQVTVNDERVMAQGRQEVVEEEVNVDGVPRTWLVAKAPYRDENGELLGLIGISRDITDRKRAHEAQRRVAAAAEAQRAQLQAIVDRIVQGIVILDPDGTVRMMNPAALSLHGFTSVEDMHRHIDAIDRDFVLHDPDGRPLPAEDWPTARALRGEPVRNFEVHARNRRTGEPWVAIYNTTPVYDATGTLESVVVTIQDITERKRTELTLLDADRRKDEFIATLAHELRNPLAPMLNAIQLLQLDGDVDVTRQRAKDIIERQVQQMARLIDDLLDISRITLGKLTLRREPVDFGAVVDEAIELARPHITAAEHRFELQLPMRPVRLAGDATRLAQVLSNLLINAAKYTPRQGRISLAVETEADEAVIRVRDSGIGIARENLGGLFDKFSQVRSAQDRAGGGLGIGLALSKGLVHMHGGTLSASSPGVGEGAEFVIRLPATAGPMPETDIIRTATTVPIGGLKVLVADDNEDAVESAAMVLSLNGNDVKLASDGLEAVEAADRYRPDVVLLDIGMPKLNGFEACRRIRAEPWGKDMLVVAVTGWGQEEDRRRTAEAGFDAHFTKPVDFASVMALIGQRRALRSH